MYGGGDAKVLQFVVEKTDGVVLSLLVQLAQGLAERHIIIFTCNFLCLALNEGKPADNDEDDSSHGLLHYYLVRLQFHGDTLEKVEAMQHDIERLVLFPHEIETEAAGIVILELHLFMIIGSYLRQHLL